MNLHCNSPCATESPSYHGWISQDEFKEDEDETIIQEHDIIIESDIENIYTDEELSADDYDD